MVKRQQGTPRRAQRGGSPRKRGPVWVRVPQPVQSTKISLYILAARKQEGKMRRQTSVQKRKKLGGKKTILMEHRNNPPTDIKLGKGAKGKATSTGSDEKPGGRDEGQ